MKKIFILILILSYLLCSFKESEQFYIDKSKITKEMLPETMIDDNGDTSYKLSSVRIAYHGFDGKQIASDKQDLTKYDKNLYIKYAKKTDEDEYTPYIETRFNDVDVNNLIFADFDYEIDVTIKEKLALYEKRFLLYNVGKFMYSLGSISFISGQSMDWYLLYSPYYKQIILFNVGVYDNADHITHNGQRVKAVERIFIFTKE